jgi:phospholipase C
MRGSHRRTFLKSIGSAALAATLPGSIKQALAIPANNRTGTIEDVEHIVILMQENRSFDHYFGTLRGVRGFGDPRAVKLPSGESVWYQPNESDTLLPFRPHVADLGKTFLPDPPHGWSDTHAAWNSGDHDRWVPNKGVTSMTYHIRKDVPFHFALADAFTICDAYHCSLLGPTDPNRYHMWTGWVGNDGAAGGPVITNAEAGYDWSTYPERLQRAGIAWKVYQDVGHGLNAAGFWGWTDDDPYIGNYGDNSLLYFHQYQNALPGNPLADNAKAGTKIEGYDPADPNYRNPVRLLDIFRQDVRSGNLPQVSWIVAPEAYSEHPNFPPDYGAWYVSQFIDILASNPEVWSKTVLFLNYDEEGGFFDHMVPPTPPMSRDQGLSTVDTVNEIFPGDASHPAGPYGLGMRVPLIVVSPWSKGGWVNSQVFDHTSLIRFIEARFAKDNPDLIETNITPWRRAVVGDLTSAFDFATPNARRARLPSTAADFPPDFVRHADQVPVPPADQALPQQEPGVRPARALPYALHAHGRVQTSTGAFRLDFGNTGSAAAVFHVRSGNNAHKPRSYTVEPHKHLSDTWNGGADYDLSVHGPNGFFRGFKGSIPGPGKANLEVDALCDGRGNRITLVISNRALAPAKISVQDQYTGKTFKQVLEAGERLSKDWSLTRMFGWYDLVIAVDGDAGLEYRFAGHVETGRDSISDPALGVRGWSSILEKGHD